MDAQILNDILSVFTGSIDGAIAVLVGIGLSLFGILALISYYQRYATTVLYFDPRLLPTGTLFVGLYNTCRACHTRADFQHRVAAEYAEDVTQARQKGLPAP